MECPKCNSKNLKVVDKRASVDGTNRRRRECEECGTRFTTYEAIELENKYNKITQVKKRDGTIVLFDSKRITDAIFKAARAVGGHDRKTAEKLTEEVVELLNKKNDGEIPTIENIQDLVEKVLIESGHAKVAKAYILYRDSRKKVRDKDAVFLEIGKTMDEYLGRSDWRVNENSNSGFSIGGLILYISGKMTANYWLNNIYPKEVKESHMNGDIHIHDLSMFTGYCAGWSLKQLLEEGFGGVPGQLKTKPPKHFDTVIGQMINFLGTMQNEWAGAQALSSFDTYLAPFIKKDNLDYKFVKQKMQNLLFNLATPSRWGTQCVTTDTEALTDKGWKKYNEIKNEKIATFNIKTKKIEYLKPSRVLSYKFDGYLINLKNRSQDQLVTPDHKVVRKVFNSNKYELIEADKLMKYKTPIQIPVGAEINNKKEIDDNLVKLFAWLVSEGCFSDGKRNRVYIFQSKKHKQYCNEIRNVLKKLKFKWDEGEKTSGFGSKFKTIRFRLNQDSSRKVRKYLNNKKIPDLIRTLSVRQIKLFIDTYIKGDGHKSSNGRMRIYTKNEDVRDSLQELCALSGFSTTILKRKNGVYTINLIRNKVANITSITKKKYKGKVWCPTTKNGTFVARRNGKVFITGNTPFINLTFDWVVPEDMKNQKAIVAGKEQDFTYGDCQKEMDVVNKAFIECMTEGDASGRVFTFPIPTYNITRDFNWDSENADLLFEMTAKYGIPYFQNFVNSDLKPTDVRSMCCRLQLDLRKLRKKTGGLFGSGENTGSIGVVTINLPRIGYLTKTKEEFFEKLGDLLDIGKISLEIKRNIIQKQMDAGLLPYTKRYLESLKHHFSTIGLNGMNEACLNFLNKDIGTEDGKEFAGEVLDFMRVKISGYQEETGNIYNLEATPAEGTSYRFAKMDKEKYPNIITAGDEEPYYTNSSLLPVGFTDDIFEVLDHQDSLQTKYTGGCIEKGNKVLTNKGLLNIEYLVKNFKELKPIKALSHNPKKGISEWDEIVDAMSIDVKERNKIRIKGERNLDITTSDWHPFFVSEKIKINPSCPICRKKVKNKKAFAAHLRHYKKCRNKYKKISKYETVEKRADNLKVGDYILQNSNNLYPDKLTKLNKDIMWLIGFFIGDGCISKFIDNRGGNRLKKYRISFHSEHTMALDKVRRILLKYFGVKANIIKNDKRSEKLRGIFTSKRNVCEFFFKYGFISGKKVYKVNIPKKVKENLNKINMFSLLSGLADSDGHISKRDGNFEYYTVSSQLADDILEMCSCAGIMINKKEKVTKRKNEVNIYRLKIPSYQMTKMKNKLDITVNLLRIKENLSNRKKRHFPIIRTKEISKVGVKDNQFYDLTTKNNHNYLAGKNSLVFIHNTVVHGFLGERILDAESCKALVKKIAYNYRLPYYTISPTFSVCMDHGYINGEVAECPKCGKVTEVYSRVVGYLRPVSYWNKGKKEEYKGRKVFNPKHFDKEIKPHVIMKPLTNVTN